MAILAMLGLTPVHLVGLVLLAFGYFGATWSAYNKGEAACVARHEEAARELQRKLDAQTETWRLEVQNAAEADRKLNEATDSYANAQNATDASASRCAGPVSMRYLDSIK